MKSNKLFLIVPFLFLIFGINGCKNEEDLDIYEDIAIVTYSEPAADGCGWKINIHQKEYHPVNLAEEYKIHELKVSIKYNLLPSVWRCTQWEAREFQEIKIISITEVNE